MTSTFVYPNAGRANNEAHSHMLGIGNLMGISGGPPSDVVMNNLPMSALTSLVAPIANENMAVDPSRTSVNSNAVRTPLSLLNEICTKAGANPQFEINSEGPVHKPAFDCIVKVERETFRWEARGRGYSKQDAKQEAARALLQSMDDRTEKLLTPAVKPPRPATPEPDVDPDVSGNPVGDLNDLCMRVRITPPKYESVGEEGKPHARVYFVECILTSKIRETGKGRNKKHAKRVAASAVLKILHDTGKLNGEIANIFTQDEVDQLGEKMGALQIGFTKYFKDINGDAPQRAVDLIQTFMSMSGPKIDSLSKMSQKEMAKRDSLPLLKEISEEQNFSVEFYDLGIQSDDPRHRCFVYCNLSPTIIRLGTGSNPVLAQKSAAFEVLEFLRNLIHK